MGSSSNPVVNSGLSNGSLTLSGNVQPIVSLEHVPLPHWCNRDTTEILLNAQFAQHRIQPNSDGAFQHLVNTERRNGYYMNTAVTKDLYAHIEDFYISAQTKALNKMEERLSLPLCTRSQSILFAPTGANIDNNLTSDAVSHLINQAIHQFSPQAIAAQINKIDGAFLANAETPIELVASLIKIGCHSKEEDKIRLRATADVRNWIEKTLDDCGYQITPCLGNAPVVCATLGKVLAYNPTLVAQGKFSQELIDMLPSDLKLANGSAETCTVADLETAEVNNNHYPIFMNQGGITVSEELESFFINAANCNINSIQYLDVLVTGSNGASWQDFALIPDDIIRHLASKNAVVVLSAVQNLRANEESFKFLEKIKLLKDSGCAVALLYIKSKFPEDEIAVFKKIRDLQCVDYMGVNAEEAAGLLQQIAKDCVGANYLACDPDTSSQIRAVAGLSGRTNETWNITWESPQWLTYASVLLKKTLDLPALRLRARNADILVSDPAGTPTPEEITENLFNSRNIAVLKAGCYPQLIQKPGDLAMLRNPPSSKSMAAYCAIATSLQVLTQMSEAEKKEFLFKGYFDTTEFRLNTYPTQAIRVFDGGMVSAGDYMDGAFCMFSSEFLGKIRVQNNASK